MVRSGAAVVAMVLQTWRNSSLPAPVIEETTSGV